MFRCCYRSTIRFPPKPGRKAESAEDAVESGIQPEGGRAQFAALPGELSRPKRYTELATALKDHLYRNQQTATLEMPVAEADF